MINSSSAKTKEALARSKDKVIPLVCWLQIHTSHKKIRKGFVPAQFDMLNPAGELCPLGKGPLIEKGANGSQVGCIACHLNLLRIRMGRQPNAEDGLLLKIGGKGSRHDDGIQIPERNAGQADQGFNPGTYCTFSQL